VDQGPDLRPDRPGAKANDPATWATFPAAWDYCLQHAGDVDGVGFVFAQDDPFSGIDLDNARDVRTGQLEPWAARVVEDLDSYAEVSPSGTGVKIFVAARDLVFLPEDRA
jgi:primase-polymerase (primpol)-like protein